MISIGRLSVLRSSSSLRLRWKMHAQDQATRRPRRRTPRSRPLPQGEHHLSLLVMGSGRAQPGELVVGEPDRAMITSRPSAEANSARRARERGLPPDRGLHPAGILRQAGHGTGRDAAGLRGDARAGPRRDAAGLRGEAGAGRRAGRSRSRRVPGVRGPGPQDRNPGRWPPGGARCWRVPFAARGGSDSLIAFPADDSRPAALGGRGRSRLLLQRVVETLPRTRPGASADPVLTVCLPSGGRGIAIVGYSRNRGHPTTPILRHDTRPGWTR